MRPDGSDNPPTHATEDTDADHCAIAAETVGTEAADQTAEVTGADSDAAGDGSSSGEVEGPRRRARRERAERRAAQARAEAIEQARREAKRRARGRPVQAPKAVPRGAIRGLKLFLVITLASVLAVGAGLILYFTPLMSVRDIEVTGLTEVPREEVLDAANVQLGTPLLQIDTGKIANRVATIRRVASARVQRHYPSALRIVIEERIPVAVKDLADGPHLFDRDGVDFATAPPPSMLPYLDVDDPAPADPATTAALQVVTALAPEVVDQVSRVAAESVDSITLTLVDGRTVIWGSTDRTAEKAHKLAALLTRPAHVYDVSSPDLPTVK